MTDLSFVPGVALGLTLGIGGTWMAMRGLVAEAAGSADYERATANFALSEHRETLGAHSRCSDALNVCQSKLSDVRDLLSQPETIRKADLRRILGDSQ